MRSTQAFIVVMSLAVVMMRPSAAAAQLSGRESAIGSLPIAVGQKVSITTGDGRAIKGTVQVVTPTTIELGDGTTRTSISAGDVRLIQLLDSVTNGVVKGALIGALVGSLVVAAVTAVDITESLFAGDGDFSKVGDGGDAGFFGSIAIGALLGYAIDAGKVKTIYEHQGSGMVVSLRPIVSAAGKGVGVRVRW